MAIFHSFLYVSRTISDDSWAIFHLGAMTGESEENHQGFFSQRDQQGLRIDRINWSTCYLSTGVAESEIVGFQLGLSQTIVSTGPQVVCGVFFLKDRKPSHFRFEEHV